MCDPTLAALSVSAAGSATASGMDYLGARAQYAADKKARKLSIKSAEEAFALETSDALEAFNEAATSASYEAQEAAIASVKAQGMAASHAGNAGVSGTSMRELINDYTASEARYREVISQRVEFERNEVRRLRGRSYKDYKDAVRRMPKPAAPSIGAFILGGTADMAKGAAPIIAGM